MAFDDVVIYRIVLLNSTVVQQFSFSLPASVNAGGQPLAATLAPTEQHFANMQIDVNIVPTGREFSAEEQTAILQELVEESFRIVRVGSVKALSE